MENIQKPLSKESALKVLQEMENNGVMHITEELIKDNVISFVVKDVKYRIRLLNFREKEELDTLRRKKFGQLLQDKDLMLEDSLIKVYKERGIDIADFDDKMSKIDAEMHDKKLALGEALAKNGTEVIFKAYEKQINELIVEKNVLYVQKNTLLEYSIENQLINFVTEVITYLSTEIEVEGEYIRLWKNIEDFRNCQDNELTDKAAVMSTLLQYSI